MSANSTAHSKTLCLPVLECSLFGVDNTVHNHRWSKRSSSTSPISGANLRPDEHLNDFLFRETDSSVLVGLEKFKLGQRRGAVTTTKTSTGEYCTLEMWVTRPDARE